jgi:7-cyano-7-deazaguanine synthase
MRKPDVCLTIDYGQTPAIGEIRAAKNIASFLSLNCELLSIDASKLGSGLFWPFRNQFLITLAAMKFIGASNLTITIGSVKGDSSHIDGTDEFFKIMHSLMTIQEGHVDVIAPAIEYESIELMRMSRIDADILDMTFSCFKSEFPCGRRRGCLKNESLRAAYYGERPTCYQST